MGLPVIKETISTAYKPTVLRLLPEKKTFPSIEYVKQFALAPLHCQPENLEKSFPVEEYPITHILIDTLSESEKHAIRTSEGSQSAGPIIGLYIAKLLDESCLVSQREPTQQENVKLLEDLIGHPLSSPHRFSDISLKVQAFHLLAKNGLADPNTRCLPAINLLESVARIIHLWESNNKKVWISTAKTKDYVDLGLTSLEQSFPFYNSQCPNNLVLPKKSLALFARKYPNTLSAIQENTLPAPLFKGISSYRQLFFEIVPQLLLIANKKPQAFLKIFPQDETQLSAANLLIEWRYNAYDPRHPGPSITLEAFDTHTPRNGKIQSRARLFAFPSPVIIADQESALLLTKLLSQPLRTEAPFILGLTQILKTMASPTIVFECMIDQKSQKVAFFTDLNMAEPPISKATLGNWGPTPALKTLLDGLPKARIINPQEYQQPLADIRRLNQLKASLSYAEGLSRSYKRNHPGLPKALERIENEIGIIRRRQNEFPKVQERYPQLFPEEWRVKCFRETSH